MLSTFFKNNLAAKKQSVKMCSDGGGFCAEMDVSFGNVATNLRKWFVPERYVFLEEVTRALLYRL